MLADQLIQIAFHTLSVPGYIQLYQFLPCVTCGKWLRYLLIHPVHINTVTLKVWATQLI